MFPWESGVRTEDQDVEPKSLTGTIASCNCFGMIPHTLKNDELFSVTPLSSCSVTKKLTYDKKWH